MGRTVYMTEAQLHDIVTETADILISEGWGRNLGIGMAMTAASMFGGGSAYGQSDGTQRAEPKVSMETQHQLYNRLHPNDTLSYQDYAARIGNVTQALKSNSAKCREYRAILSFTDEYCNGNSEAFRAAYPHKSTPEGKRMIDKYGVSNLTEIYGYLIPVSTTLQQFRKAVNDFR